MENKILTFDKWRDENLEEHLRLYGDYNTDDFMVALLFEYERYKKGKENDKDV